MKKIFLLLNLFLLGQLFSQNAYYDALKLRSLKVGKRIDSSAKIIRMPGNEEIYKVLKYYVLPEDSDSKDKIAKAFSTNPFIRLDTAAISHASITGGMPGVFPAVGGVEVTNFADGLAKFLVKRAKEELTNAFFTKFKSDLDSISQLKVLFPYTYQTLLLIDENAGRFTGYLNTLREAFEKDLSDQLNNIQNLLSQPIYRDYLLAKEPFLGSMFYTALYITNELNAGKHPGEVFASYNSDFYLNTCYAKNCDTASKAHQENLRGTIKTLQLFSTSFRSRSKTNYWVSVDSAGMLLNDTINFRIYLGLMYQTVKKKDIEFGNKQTLANTLQKLAGLPDSIVRYKNYIALLCSRANNINNMVNELRSKNKPDRKPGDQYRVFAGTSDLLEQAAGLLDLPFINFTNEKEVRAKLSDLVRTSRSFGSLYVDITAKRYSSAVLEVLIVMETLHVLNKKQNEKLLKYGSFMAAIVQAESSDQVEEAIEAIALPPGSFRTKRESSCNIALNAYLGLFGGGEQIKGADKAPVFSYGITAPVGVSFSTSKKCGSSSFFISIIDIGAVTAFRFQNDSIAQVPSIQLRNIFSPGAFYSYGFPNSPVSLNFGAQIGPNLRKVSSTTNNYADNMYVRYSVSIVIDIPLLNFKTKPRELD